MGDRHTVVLTRQADMDSSNSTTLLQFPMLRLQ